MLKDWCQELDSHKVLIVDGYIGGISTSTRPEHMQDMTKIVADLDGVVVRVVE